MDAEQLLQALKPETSWSQPPPNVPEAATIPDPGTHSASAFTPPQAPYADGNAMALLQQWWAYYAQQRPLQPAAQAQNGGLAGGFNAPAGDPSLPAALPQILSSLGPKPDAATSQAFAQPGNTAQPADAPTPTSMAAPTASQLPLNRLRTSLGQDIVSSGGTALGAADAKDGGGSGLEPTGSDEHGSGDLGVRSGGVKCAKEKNRQAQRRFRERQKTLISALKERADALAKQVEDQGRVLEGLEKENMLLKAMLGDVKPAMLPAQLQQASAQAQAPASAPKLPSGSTPPSAALTAPSSHPPQPSPQPPAPSAPPSNPNAPAHGDHH